MKKHPERYIVAAMMIGLFMASLDNTIVSASLNSIIEKIGGFEKMSWVFTAYMLASTSTLLIFGKLSDIYGRKLFFLIGIAVFVGASALCGTAQTIEQLIAYRALQGIGAGALLPISFTIIFSVFNDPTKAAKMTGIFAAVFGLSSVLGPQLGTWISEGMGWRWCFYINVPLGIASFLILTFALKETKATEKPKIDYLGTILLIITVISLMLVFEFGGKDYEWGSKQILGLAGISIIGLILFIFVEKKASEPILNLSMFKHKMIAGTSFIVFCQGVLMFSAITYIPIFATGVLGREGSNGLLTPMMLSLMIGASLGGMLITKFAFRSFYLFSMAGGIVASYLLFSVNQDTDYYKVILIMIVLGLLAIGPLMSVAQNAVANAVPKDQLGSVNSIVAFFRNIGGIFGASIMATIVNNSLESDIKEKLSHASIPADKLEQLSNPEVLLRATDQIPAQVVAILRDSLSSAISHGFLFALGVSAIGFLSAFLVGKARYDVSKLGK